VIGAVRGLFLCLREEIKAMRRCGGGAIVNVGSVAGQRAFRGNSPDNASKAAVHMLTRSAAVECAQFGVRISEVEPGPVRTPTLTGCLGASQSATAPITEEGLRPDTARPDPRSGGGRRQHPVPVLGEGS
jgi:A-factor type gamma-butyrolactone 1'-reductase (1S-forming)